MSLDELTNIIDYYKNELVLKAKESYQRGGNNE